MNEKELVVSTMSKLCNELRTMTERCMEYETQVNDLSQQFKAAEEEKKTIAQLLQLAIKQKRDLCERFKQIQSIPTQRSGASSNYIGYL